MRVRDPREPDGWRDEGPSQAVAAFEVGGSTTGFVQSPELADGRCPICDIRMNRGNQRSCVKVPHKWGDMRKRGRGGFVFGKARMAA